MTSDRAAYMAEFWALCAQKADIHPLTEQLWDMAYDLERFGWSAVDVGVLRQAADIYPGLAPVLAEVLHHRLRDAASLVARTVPRDGLGPGDALTLERTLEALEWG